MARLSLLLAVALSVALALAVVTWLYPSPGDFSYNNTSWNGSREFLKRSHGRAVRSLTDLRVRPSETALVLVPYAEFKQPELAFLADFVNEGGVLVLMDDYGHGNEVLKRLGLEARFVGRPLLDPLFTHKSEWLPRIRNVAPTLKVTELVLNHATALTGVAPDTVLASSSLSSFLDLNNNERWDGATEPQGPFPVAARLAMGQGYVVLVADPSMAINSMDLAENGAFLKDIQGPRQLLLDQSHLPRDQSVDIAQATLRASRRALATPLGGLAIVLAVLAPSMWPLLRNKGGNR